MHRRPELTARVFQAIRQAKPAKLFLVADGPRPGDELEARCCAQVRALADEVDWDCDVVRHFSEDNLGLRARVSSGLNFVFSQVEEAIILEDDCLPEPSFFRYCNELLGRYRDDSRVMLVSGDNAHGYRSPKSYSFTRYPLIWGWATWRRAWTQYDDAMTDWPDRREAGWLENLFADSRAVAYWRGLFDDCYRRSKSWARAWVYACFKAGGLCAVPRQNQISNVGFGSVATHTFSLLDKRSAATTRHLAFPLEHPDDVRADTEADTWIERRVFSGADVPVSRDAKDTFAALAAWKRGRPWEALRRLAPVLERLPGASGPTIGQAAGLARLGLWESAEQTLEPLRTRNDAYPRELAQCITHGKASSKVRFKPTEADRQSFLRSLDLAPRPDLIKLGGDERGYGPWVVPSSLLHSGSVCVLAGAGEDITFDCRLAERFGCRVEIFDPTPRARAHFAGLGRHINQGAPLDDPLFKKYHGVSPETFALLRYHPFGLSDCTATMRFYEPLLPEHVSHSIFNLQKTSNYFEAQCLSLPDVMTMLGKSRIDFLKLDIEGAEYVVTDSILVGGLDIGVICIEFDEGYNPLDGGFLQRMSSCVRALREGGWRAVCLDDWNVTFVHSSEGRIPKIQIHPAQGREDSQPMEKEPSISHQERTHPV